MNFVKSIKKYLIYYLTSAKIELGIVLGIFAINLLTLQSVKIFQIKGNIRKKSILGKEKLLEKST